MGEDGVSSQQNESKKFMNISFRFLRNILMNSSYEQDAGAARNRRAIPAARTALDWRPRVKQTGNCQSYCPLIDTPNYERKTKRLQIQSNSQSNRGEML